MKVLISEKKRRRKTLPYFVSGAIAAIGHWKHRTRRVAMGEENQMEERSKR